MQHDLAGKEPHMIVKLLIILHHSFNHCLNLNLTINTTKIPQEESNNPAEIKVHISQPRDPQLQDYCSERKRKGTA